MKKQFRLSGFQKEKIIRHLQALKDFALSAQASRIISGGISDPYCVGYPKEWVKEAPPPVGS